MKTATRTRKPKTSRKLSPATARLLAAARRAVEALAAAGASDQVAELSAAITAVDGLPVEQPGPAVVAYADLPALVRQMGAENHNLVSLADLREAAGLPRAEFDRAFLAAWRAGKVSTAALESTRDCTEAEARRLLDGCLEHAGERIGYAIPR
jgi:hypothetical protein